MATPVPRLARSPAPQRSPKEHWTPGDVRLPEGALGAPVHDLTPLWTVLPRQLSGSQMGHGLPPVATPAQARALRLGDTSVPLRPAPPAAGPARPGLL